MKKILLSVFITLFLSEHCLAQVSTDSLVVKYLFTGNTFDSSGNNRHATIIGSGVSLTTDRFGKSNNAYMFNGTGGHMKASIGRHTEAVTIAFWYYSDRQTAPYPHFFDYGDYKYRCHVMWGSIYNSTDRFGILLETYNSKGNLLRGSIKPKDSTWVHVAVTFNKNTRKEKIYINGVFDKQMTIDSGFLDLKDDTLCIGKIAKASTDNYMTYFNGKIDDFYVYARELDTGEVKIMADKKSNVGPSAIEKITALGETLIIYPNPTTSSILFDNYNQESLPLSYKIFDITGKQVQAGVTKGFIDIANLSSGTYFVRFSTDDNLYVTQKKFIKE